MSLFVVDRPRWPRAAWLTHRASAQCLVLIMVLAVLLSATGACDTDNLGLIHRTSLWLVISALVVIQAVALHLGLRAWIASDATRRIMASAATVVLTTIELHLLKYTPFLPKQPDPPLEFLVFVLPLAGPVALLALTLVPAHAELKMTHRREARSASPTASKAETWPTAKVLRVTAQDHYLCVYTAHGSQLIRGRMKDALGMLAAAPGMQIHRSHWVARDAIVRIVRAGRDYRAVLQDGATLPVGRSRIAALRAFID